MQHTLWPRVVEDAPEESGEYFRKRALARAGEYFVGYLLSREGYDCCFAAEGLKYDLVADIGDKLVRIQVKSTSAPCKNRTKRRRKVLYEFHYRAGANRSSSLRGYIGHIDLFAFVALDRNSALFVLPDKVAWSFMAAPEEFTPEKTLLSLESALSALK
jgi:hypothetical protein|tara:strand:+ start:5715 stop:6191 length:477 start_codon:yes stop_codon:yes gene_type:complete